MLQTQTTFMESCKLMELDAIGNTTIIDSNKLRNTTGPDGTIFTERRLSLSVEFLGGLFMKIDQKPEYTGQFNAKANETEAVVKEYNKLKLKVVTNVKQGSSGRWQMIGIGLGSCTVMPLRGILVSILHECKWARGQLSFKAKEIECASCDAENC
jgi:hypothetical protein